MNQILAVLIGGSGAHVVKDIHLSDDWCLTLLPSDHNLDAAVATKSRAKTAVQKREEARAEQQMKCLKGSKAPLLPRRKLLFCNNRHYVVQAVHLPIHEGPLGVAHYV